MTDRQRAITAAALGAVAGGVVGYLFFTERGRALRRSLEPAVDDLVRELGEFRGTLGTLETLTRASSVAGYGWRLLHEVMNDPRFVEPRQTSPF